MTAQSQFRTSELRRLATVLSIDTSQLTEGYSHPMVKGLALTIHQERKTIDHIGLQLFSLRCGAWASRLSSISWSVISSN